MESLPWPKLFFYSVLALYAYFILRGILRSIRGRFSAPPPLPPRDLSRRKRAELAAAAEEAIRARNKPNPFTARPNALDFLVPTIDHIAKKLETVGEDPIMRVRINSRSEKFFAEREEEREAKGEEKINGN